MWDYHGNRIPFSIALEEVAIAISTYIKIFFK
jgi:hypothetical protein